MANGLAEPFKKRSWSDIFVIAWSHFFCQPSSPVWVPVWISNLDMSLVSILIQSFVLTCSVNQAATFPGVLLSKVLYFKHWEFSYCDAIVLAIFAAAPNCYRRKQCHAGSADVNSVSMSCYYCSGKVKFSATLGEIINSLWSEFACEPLAINRTPFSYGYTMVLPKNMFKNKEGKIPMFWLNSNSVTIRMLLTSLIFQVTNIKILDL